MASISCDENLECQGQVIVHSLSEKLVASRTVFCTCRMPGQNCFTAALLIIVMISILATVIVVPLVIETTPVHKKYQNHIVSVMSKEQQRLLILKARQSCYKLAVQRYKERSNITSGPSMCWVAWDGILCWDRIAVGHVAQQLCPDYVNAFNTDGFATRSCTENGSWWVNPDPDVNNTWTNFSECMKPGVDLNVHMAHGDQLRLLYTIGYSFSLGALLVAIIIMLCCKRLHSKSNTLHVNLFLAFVMRAAVSFLKDILFVQNVGLAKDVHIGKDGILEFVHNDTHWECKLLISVFMYSVNACNMWIFAEALYLTMLVSRPLATERGGVKVYIILGWTLSFAFIIPWIIMKALYENTFCWNIQQDPDYYWILRGSGVAVVVINFFLFLNIFRKLFLKLRHSSQLGVCGKTKYRKLAKFILVLIPLFGIMYILFYVAVPSNFEETSFNVAYLYLEMGYNSFQGFLLALLFCFLNEEVHGELKRLWQRYRSRHHEMSTIKSYYFHSPSHKTVSSKSDSRSSKKSSYDHSDRLLQNKLHQNRSVSVDRFYDPSCVTDVSSNNSKVSCQMSASESLPQTYPPHSGVHRVFSRQASMEHSDVLLKQAVQRDIQQRITRQSTGESTTSRAVSLPNEDYPGNVCLSGSNNCGHTRL